MPVDTASLFATSPLMMIRLSPFSASKSASLARNGGDSSIRFPAAADTVIQITAARHRNANGLFNPSLLWLLCLDLIHLDIRPVRHKNLIQIDLSTKHRFIIPGNLKAHAFDFVTRFTDGIHDCIQRCLRL